MPIRRRAQPIDAARRGLPSTLAALALLVVLAVPPAATARVDDAGGVTTITGTAKLSNPFFLEANLNPFVLLTDLTAFVKRDRDQPLPSFTQQVITGLEGNIADGATFSLALPITPRGAFNDVGHGDAGEGVQVYSVDLVANEVGDPFLGPYEAAGWPTGDSSLKVEIGSGEVIGGEMVVWAPDDREKFPTDDGPDGKLFTEDDPVAPIAAGWTVIDLDAHPFGRLREATVDVPIVEGDAGLKDLSQLSYTAAFDALVAELRLRYPFTEVKRLDWDAIVADIRPQVEQAERDGDQDAFTVAMMRFAVRVHDGHVGGPFSGDYVGRTYGGGVGMTLAQTDDGKVIVTSVGRDMPAARAGIEPGAALLQWGDQPVAGALENTELIFSASSPHTTRLQQLALLPRMPVGTTVTVRYRNPGAAAVAADLVAVADGDGLRDALGRVLGRRGGGNPAEMPITVQVLPSGIGYVKVRSFIDDAPLLVDAWEWSLKRLAALKVPAVIVDVRGNGGGFGGLSAYFAGSFTKDRFVLAEEFDADPRGVFQPNGADTIDPAPIQWDRPVAVLIDPGCASACELFAAAVKHDPSHLIVGSAPTAGVEASVYPWLLPGNLSFQAPLGLLRDPRGNVFLEGTGVVPTVKVPVTVKSLLSTDDAVLKAAEQALRR